MESRRFSTNPLHYVYALVWLTVFTIFAIYIFSGKIFLPDTNGNMSIVATLIGWVAQYLTQVGTGILVVFIGLVVAFRVATQETKNQLI